MTEGNPGIQVRRMKQTNVEMVKVGPNWYENVMREFGKHYDTNWDKPLTIMEIQARLDAEERDSQESVIECIPAQRGPHVVFHEPTGRSEMCGGPGACRTCSGCICIGFVGKAGCPVHNPAPVQDNVNRCDKCRKPMDTKRPGLCPVCMVELGENYPMLKERR